MKTISVHATRDQRSFAEDNREDMLRSLDKLATYPNLLTALNFLMSDARRVASYGLVSGFSPDQILQGLRIDAQVGVAVFDLAMHPNEDRAYAIDGRSITLRLASAHGYTMPNEWLYAYAAARAVRDYESARWLASVPSDVVRRSQRVEQYDDFMYVLVDGVAELELQKPSARELLQRACELAQPEHAKVDPTWTKRIALPTAQLALRLAEGDPTEFNEALVRALQEHKSYWGRKTEVRGLARCDDPDGLLASWPLGLACLAHDRGIGIDVESGYIPSWIVQRRW